MRMDDIVNDTISRQVAIKAADSIIERDTSGNNDVVKAMTAWKEYIEALPPAQPEWIPCSERLPGKDESFYVLCCDKYGEIMIGNVFECYDGETPYSAESEHEYMYDCVAWMPLPEPWKGEQP